MEIVRYVVERFTGTDTKHETVETTFPPQGVTTNPIADRREAFQFAQSLLHTLLEAEADGTSPYQSRYSLGGGTENRFQVFIQVIYKENGNEESETIFGVPLQGIIDNLEEEADCYAENGYDTGGDLHYMNATVIGRGYVAVLKDDYEYYHEFLEELEKDND